VRHAKSLQVGIGNDEFDALHAGVNHAVDGIAATSADSDDFDFGVVPGFLVKADANVVAHLILLDDAGEFCIAACRRADFRSGQQSVDSCQHPRLAIDRSRLTTDHWPLLLCSLSYKHCFQSGPQAAFLESAGDSCAMAVIDHP